MIIKKILNNNVVITLNEHHEEIVVMGKGLAYGKKTGDYIDPSKINKTLSEKRAANVADALTAKGVTVDRIIVDSKGDTVQPYKTPEENRVSICIAE